MRRLDVAFTRRTHDVVEHRSELHDFETRFAKIAIPAHVAITEAQNVTELVRERPRRKIAGTERDITSNKTVRRLRTRRQHGPVLGKFRDVRSHVEVSAAL